MKLSGAIKFIGVVAVLGLVGYWGYVTAFCANVQLNLRGHTILPMRLVAGSER